jgi:hypothetical protein
LGLLEKTIPLRKHTSAEKNDIYSGDKYQKLVEKNLLGGMNQLSMNIFYDGASRYNANSLEFFPIWGSINEIPLSDRFKAQNIFLLGLYFGIKKPSGNMVLGPLINQFINIYEIPPEIEIYSKLTPVNCVLFAVVCDLPAKAAIMGLTQHNGYSGCPKCYQVGEYVQNRICYPYVPSHRRKLRKLKKIEHSRGMRNFSNMILIPEYNFFQDTPIEFMHLQFIGTAKKLFKLWLGGEDWKLDIDELGPTFENLKLLSTMSSFHVDLWNWKNFKAFNWKYWVLYLSFPLLWKTDIPCDWWNHWLRFIKITVLICSKSISANCVAIIEQECNSFVEDHTSLFGKEHTTINIHSLLHASIDIKHFGLAVTHSAFPFESMHGWWKREQSGTQLFPKNSLINYENHLYQNSKIPENEIVEESKITLASKIPAITHSRLILVTEHNLSKLHKLQHHLKVKKTKVAYNLPMFRSHNHRFESLFYSSLIGTSDSSVMWMNNDKENYGRIEHIIFDEAEKKIFFQILICENLEEKILHFYIFKKINEKKILLEFSEKVIPVIGFEVNGYLFFCQNVNDLEW